MEHETNEVGAPAVTPGRATLAQTAPDTINDNMMGCWETRLSRDEAGRRALTNCMYMCTDCATVIVVSPCHCMIDLVSGYVRGLACDKTSQSTVGQLARHTSW